MNKSDIEEVKSKLLEIDQLIVKLDPLIRAAAFEIMAPYYFSEIPHSPLKPKSEGKSSKDSSGDAVDTNDLGAFISAFNTDTPNENVYLMAAWLYSNYGSYPITSKEITELSDSCGLIVPKRPDNTMRVAKTAKKNGKTMFTQQGKGWQLTVSGELYLKEKYGVTKGSKQFSKD